MSEIHPSNLPAWEAALLEESRAPIGHIYENILDRYLAHQRLTADANSAPLPQINMDMAEVNGHLDPKNKQIVLAANYGDLGIAIGRFDPIRNNFVTFPELLTLGERYLLHEKRIQYILEKGEDDAKRLFPLVVSNERHKQANALEPLMDNLLDFYGTLTGKNFHTDDATGVYVRQERGPGDIEVSVALEHAFSIHRRGGKEGIKRHALTKIPIIECDRLDDIDSVRRHRHASPETAEMVLYLAQEATSLWDSEAMNRRLDLTFMRYN